MSGREKEAEAAPEAAEPSYPFPQLSDPKAEENRANSLALAGCYCSCC